MYWYAELLAEWQGERWGVRAFRKQSTWYTKGFPQSAKLRSELIRVNTLTDLEGVLSQADPELEFPASALRVPRGKKSGTQKVALPEGYLDDRMDETVPGPGAEDEFSGG